MTATVPTGRSLQEPTSPLTTSADVQSLSPNQRPREWRAVLRRPLAAIAIGYLFILLLAALLADVIAPHDPAALDLTAVLSGPTSDHLLGTDALGRDVASRLIYGSRLSLVNTAIGVVTFVLIGATTGMVAGFLGGRADRAFNWVADVMMAIPTIVVILVVVTLFGGNLAFAMVAAGALGAPGFARVVRGATLAVRQEPYIAAAQVSGLPTRHILPKHVLPRVSGPIIVHVSLFAGAALLLDAGLAYLGFGPDTSIPTWGGMITEASAVMSAQPWLLVPPGVVLGLAVLAFGILGDTVREATLARTGRRPQLAVRPSARNTRVAQVWVPTTGTATPALTVEEALGSELLSVRQLSIELPVGDRATAVVQDVDLEIRPGEIIGLIGESGCGKTITASMMLGLLPPGGTVSSGVIRFKGIDLTSDPRQFKRLRGSQIAMISQEPIASLDPVYTAGQQIDELVRRHHGGSRKAARARTLELLDMVRLPDPERVVRSYPHELSGGMAQRVAIAMALAGEPALLIADEPTTALDVTVQAEILQLLKQLRAERDMSILLISHDWGVVASICHRAYVMYAGQVVESCAVDEMLEGPRHPYTLGLLASDPRGAVPHRKLAAIPGVVPAPGTWPTGCRFAPRCSFATPSCVSAEIPLLSYTSRHQTRCIHHEQLDMGRTT